MKGNTVTSRDRWWLRMLSQGVKELNKVKKWARFMFERGRAQWEGTARTKAEVGGAQWANPKRVLLGNSDPGRGGEDLRPGRSQGLLGDSKHAYSVLCVAENRSRAWRKGTVWYKADSAHTGCSAENRTDCSVPRVEAESPGRSLSCCSCCFLWLIFPAQLQSVPGQTVLVSGNPTAWLQETFWSPKRS